MSAGPDAQCLLLQLSMDIKPKWQNSLPCFSECPADFKTLSPWPLWLVAVGAWETIAADNRIRMAFQACLIAFVVGITILSMILGVCWSLQRRVPSPSSIPNMAKTNYSRALVLVRVVTVVTSIGEGYDMTTMSGAIQPCKADIGLSAGQVAWVMGIVSLVMAFSSPVGGWLADCFGRVSALAISYVALIAGPAVLFIANSFPVLFLGRVIVAFGMGAGLSVNTTYMTEVAPAAIRGQLPGLEESFICVGMVLAFFGNYALVDMPGGWRWMLGLGCVLPAVMLPCLLLGVAPESPRYLLMQGRREEAEAVLFSLVGPDEAKQTLHEWSGEFHSPKASWEKASCPKKPGWAQALWPEDPLVRRALYAGICVMAMQMLCGINTLSNYGGTLLGKQMGARVANIGLMFIAVSRFLVTIPSVLLMDIVGRRPLLLVSSTGTCVAAVLLGISYLTEARALPWKYMAMTLFMTFYSSGLGPVAYVYGGEVMDNRVRSKGMGAAIFVARLISGIYALGFPAVNDHVGTGGVFVIIGGINALIMLFILFFVPETKGTSLESISKCFE